MALTEHQLFHLNAILTEVEETKNLASISKEKFMVAKEIKDGEYDKYLDQIIKDVAEIKKSGIFPILKSDASIHNYIEKDTKEEFK